MIKTDYRKVYAMKAEREKRIKKICPKITNSSGIYVFHRTDESGIRRGYCGQALHLLERCASHLAEYDHIALSLKKHGFKSEDNPYGWELWFTTCRQSELDEKEVEWIKKCADSGMQMYNVTAGSQGKGKQVTGQYKQPKTYTQGVHHGRKTMARDLSHIIEKHLTVEIRADKQGNKVSGKQFDKFKELLKEGDSNADTDS